MNDADRSFAELLQRTTPEPPAAVDFQALTRRVRRRRTTRAIAAGASAVLATIAVVGGLALLDRRPSDGREAPIATDAPSPTAGTNGLGCPPTEPHPNGLHIDVDYVPFIVLRGQDFISRLTEVPPLSRRDLGDQVATVSCRIADLTEDSRIGVVGRFPDDYLDGNAAYLEVGTPIYAVDGFDPSCRVAVIEDGEVVPYLAQHEVERHSVPLDCAITPSEAPAKHPVDTTQVTVSTHCGVVSVTVKGELWLAEPPLGDHNPPPGWDENRETGSFTTTGPDRAEFRTSTGQRASFVRAEAGTPDPNVGCE